MSYSWTAHYINSEDDINTIEDVVKSSADTRFKICELKFRTQELRQAFNEKLKQKFVATCGTKLDKVAVDRLFDKDVNVWVTPYGNIKLSYADMEF